MPLRHTVVHLLQLFGAVPEKHLLAAGSALAHLAVVSQADEVPRVAIALAGGEVHVLAADGALCVVVPETVQLRLRVGDEGDEGLAEDEDGIQDVLVIGAGAHDATYES